MHDNYQIIQGSAQCVCVSSLVSVILSESNSLSDEHRELKDN